VYHKKKAAGVRNLYEPLMPAHTFCGEMLGHALSQSAYGAVYRLAQSCGKSETYRVSG